MSVSSLSNSNDVSKSYYFNKQTILSIFYPISLSFQRRMPFNTIENLIRNNHKFFKKNWTLNHRYETIELVPSFLRKSDPNFRFNSILRYYPLEDAFQKKNKLEVPSMSMAKFTKTYINRKIHQKGQLLPSLEQW